MDLARILRAPLSRRCWLGAGTLPFLSACAVPGAPSRPAAQGPAGAEAPAGDPAQALAALEARSGGRLGVALLDGPRLLAGYRHGERFPFASTFKVLLAAQALHRAVRQPGLLERRLHYRQADLHTYAPVTSRFLSQGMTVAELCAATIAHSDNVAANLLLRELGGPAALTAYVRGLGDPSFRLDRWEPELNTALPGDERDTGMPLHLAQDLHRLLLADGLPPAAQGLLAGWMRATVTGDRRIRAGVPAGWTVGDKTGTGGYGTTNDLAVLWPASGRPLVLAVYFTQPVPDAPAQEAVVAEATRIVLARRG